MQQDNAANREGDAEPLDVAADAAVVVPAPVQVSHAAAGGDAATLQETTPNTTAEGDAQQQDSSEMLPGYAKTAEVEQAGPSAEPISTDNAMQSEHAGHSLEGATDSDLNVNGLPASTVNASQMPSATSPADIGIAEQQPASQQEAQIPQAEEVAIFPSTGEQEWPLKSILWPPFAQHPQEVKILIQDVNGPCSFLALCNVLLLRGDIRLPLDKKTATFGELSGQVGDYLVRNSTANPDNDNEGLPEATPSSPTNNLDFALNTLPKTLSGLDVNVNFITGGFSESQDSSSSSSHSELGLFKLAKVDFKHGWIVSQDDDKDVYEVLVTIANDYDTAVNVLVEGDAIAQGNITGNSTFAHSPTAVEGEVQSGETGNVESSASPAPPAISPASNTQNLETLFEELSMEPNKQAKVYQATIINRFLKNTSTQLTYTGLFKLSAELLKPDSLCALFRNSHFSVLYRRPNELAQSHNDEESQPFSDEQIQSNRLPQATLFQLVTDQALLHEPNAVWESLEDVDGSASQFFDSRLQPARIRQDWVSRSARDTVQVEQDNQMHDADMALAAQLQQDEYDAEDQTRQTRTASNNNNDNNNNSITRRNVQFDGLPTQYTSNQSDQSNSRRRSIGGKRPEELDSQVLSRLGAQTSKKQKEKPSDDKKGKKGCVIC